MDPAAAFSVVSGAVFVLFVGLVVLSRRARRHGGSYRAGVVGAVYEMQNRDKQRALEIIVEGKAAARRPEYPDGNLPELESPGQKHRRD
jgi:hypothetical protein